jgi:protein involved in polysaccharide export with SLBB domain
MNALNEPEVEFPETLVSKTGFLVLPRLGKIPTENITVKEFRELLTKRVAQSLYLKSPILYLDFVKHIQVYLVQGDNFMGKKTVVVNTTVGELLSRDSIDPEEQLDFEKVTVTRNSKTMSLNLLKNTLDMDFKLQDGDRIYIPNYDLESENSYYLAGHFVRPGRYIKSRKNVTLMDVLATNGALSEPNYTRRFYVLRDFGQSTEQMFTIDARALMKMGDLSQNIKIQGSDIILASIERKVHTLNKIKNLLHKYTDINTPLKNANPDYSLFK